MSDEDAEDIEDAREQAIWASMSIQRLKKWFDDEERIRGTRPDEAPALTLSDDQVRRFLGLHFKGALTQEETAEWCRLHDALNHCKKGHSKGGHEWNVERCWKCDYDELLANIDMLRKKHGLEGDGRADQGA